MCVEDFESWYRSLSLEERRLARKLAEEGRLMALLQQGRLDELVELNESRQVAPV